MNKKAVWWALMAVAVVAGGGYALTRRDSPTRPAAAGAAEPPTAGPPISVSTVPARRRDVDITLQATGTVSALTSVAVRPQVSSTISKVHIREGQFVKAGAVLFTLDSRADEVNVTRARAQLAKDQAALADAQRQLARSRELLAENFVSQGAVDTNRALVESAAAVVAADRAAVQAAQVALSFNRIVAPTAGRAGAINVYAGSYVQPAGEPLVTITQMDPMAVSFNLPQRNLGDALQTLRSGGGTVTALLPEGRGTLSGKLQFVDNSVDATSGTVKVKAVFDNREEKLWPGAYVTVRLVVSTLKDAVTVPQAAIIQGARSQTLYVVGPDRKAALRPVDVLQSMGEDAVVKGVRPGELIVLDGRQNLRPGATVVVRNAAASASAPKVATAASPVTP